MHFFFGLDIFGFYANILMNLANYTKIYKVFEFIKKH